MESFGAAFPRVYSDSGFKGWFVSTLLLGKFIQFLDYVIFTNPGSFVAAWFGSLVNGPLADYIGRKICIIVAVVVFLVGSAIQAGAVNIPMLFFGKLEST